MGVLEAALLPSPLQVETITATAEAFVVHARRGDDGADCPRCGQSSTRVQSKYVRRLSDMPVAGRHIRVYVTVRRFHCAHPHCPRQIFAERLGAFAPPHARRTARMAGVLEAVAFALGGEAGARLARRLGLAVSPDTLLRAIRRAPAPSAPPVRVCGVDDFAWRKRRRYGTALVDLERHRRVDLLPERSAAGVAAWLSQHPGIAIVSRDRGGEYADGARRGAPQATQVADRFHLLRNLGDAVGRVLQRHAALVRRVRSPGDAPSLTHQRPDRAASRARTRAQMADCFAAVHAAAGRGLSKSAIARALGMHRHTVQKYLALAVAPERHHATRVVSMLAPYEGYLLERWRQGCRDARALWREIAALGYPGSYGPVVRALQRLRLAAAAGQAVAPSGDGLTPPRAVGVLLLRPAERKPPQLATIGQLRALHPDLGIAITLLDRFAGPIRSRTEPGQEERLAHWLRDVADSGLRELVAFGTKLRQDMEAVRAGLTLPWSQGQTEGQILKLKLLRRQMYGRGNFDLVRKRALRAA